MASIAGQSFNTYRPCEENILKLFFAEITEPFASKNVPWMALYKMSVFVSLRNPTWPPL
jgi:hypothetical protein